MRELHHSASTFAASARARVSSNDGKGEQQDVRSALDLLKRWPGIDGKRLAVVGYSFGASAVLNAIGRLKAARCFALIAPSLSSAQG